MRIDRIKVGRYYLVDFSKADSNWKLRIEMEKREGLIKISEQILIGKCVAVRTQLSGLFSLNILMEFTDKVSDIDSNKGQAKEYGVYEERKAGRYWFVNHTGIIRQINKSERLLLFSEII
jgi:hypothetical protein